ncbi:MAG: hypothetical protein CMJ27_12000 [Phycisphaerae bacterium]|nr:hypothetical protein [Phycisphaerae bacterium]MAH67085.1 hypothetical protein [Phycisphaerae bacterium]OUX93508.1 MAG: hypothetical protein CBB77_08680 [Hyphomonas sp. TMED17]
MSGFTTVLSPAKTLEMDPPSTPGDLESTTPRFAAQTRQLVETLGDQSPATLERLMSISGTLAALNHDRWQAFNTRGNPRGPAALCFRGDVYQGLEAWTMKKTSLAWAQDHVRILSGLYGLLRPLDRIQPYRLEMGTRLKTEAASNLYEFWGDRIGKALKKDMADNGSETLVNLASDEYAKAARLETLGVPIISTKFLQLDGGKAKFMSFYAKQSRGLMARWMADHRPKTIAALRKFDAEGYSLSDESTADTLVFVRPKPLPIAQRRKTG